MRGSPRLPRPRGVATLMAMGSNHAQFGSPLARDPAKRMQSVGGG
jgi:hypothetical protein